MYLQLSANAIIRQYGPYTYVLDRLNDFDQVYQDAEVFAGVLSRHVQSLESIVNQLHCVYCDVELDVLEKDFLEFVRPLIVEGVVLSGDRVDEFGTLQKLFSYDVDCPKTMSKKMLMPMARQDILSSQHLLEEYFSNNPTIFSIQIDLTQACTERCVHCYISDYVPVFLPFDIVAKTIDEFREQGGIEISFSGGECMLHPDFVRIVEYAHDLDLSIGVLTNLTCCSDEIIQVLRRVGASVQVSLYSMNSETHDLITGLPGSWKSTREGIEKLWHNNIPCSISCPTMKQNYRDYIDVLLYARTMKMDARTDFVIMGKMNGDISNLKCRLSLEETKCILEDIVYKALPINSEFFDPVKKDDFRTDEQWGGDRVCGACICSICLSATGDYYPCPGFAGIKLGNCYENSLEWVWKKSPETMRIRNVRGCDFKKCYECKDRDYCSVCMCRNYNETGDIFTPAQHFCDVAKLNHKVVDERFATIERERRK